MTRIGYVLKKFPRLSETFVLGELLAQEQLGTELHIFSRRPADDEPRHPELARLEAEIELVPSHSELDPWAELFDPPGGDVDPEDWRMLGTVVRELRSFGLTRLPRLVAEALYIRRRARTLELEHLHAHFATDSAVVALLVNALGGPSYSITAHAKDIYRSTVNARLLGLLVRRSAFTVTVCDANVRHLTGMLPPESVARIRRLYNGLHLPDFEYREGPRDDAHVLAVGRLVEKKGFDVLLDALALLESGDVSFTATIVGDGDERAALERRTAELGLQHRVTFAGPLDQARVRELLARATVFCLPCVIGSDGNRDALPTVLLESLATGLPCVSTPVTGVPEILATGEAGVLVPQRDSTATARALCSLLRDADRRRELARSGRARAEKLFDGSHNARVLADWFSEIAAAGVSC